MAVLMGHKNERTSKEFYEMAHNYGVGDEYDNETSSSLNPNINPVPNGFKGIDIFSREAVESHAPYVVATSPEQLNEGEGVNNPEHFIGKVK